jgi:hypothetical protein
MLFLVWGEASNGGHRPRNSGVGQFTQTGERIESAGNGLEKESFGCGGWKGDNILWGGLDVDFGRRDPSGKRVAGAGGKD